jgi:aminoglycoside phosphotransferase (APT) family kinase protein
MEYVTGQTLPLFWQGARSPHLTACATALAAIHDVDWRAAGLDFLQESASSPLESELAQWRRRADARGFARHPLLIALRGYLERNQPADARFALLHGDPNPGNYLIAAGRVAAVLDWELAAIGDPRSDLGFYAALRTIFGGWAGDRSETVLSTAYEDVTGARVANLEYYEAVGLYKGITAGWAGHGLFGGEYGSDAISARLDFLLGPRWAV